MKLSYRIALIGSSGGGSATISTGEDVVESIQRNVNFISRRDVAPGDSANRFVSITEVVLIQSAQGLDFCNVSHHDITAALWVMEAGRSLNKKLEGDLDKVNILLKVEDGRIATLILRDEIDAIISVSSDPEGANKLTIAAAVEKGIPILGTGGTSMSFIGTSGGNVIGCSGGSVATTGVSRGICIAAGLASYTPWGGMIFSLPTVSKLAKFRSVVGAALPILLSVSLMRAALPLCGRFLSFVFAALGSFMFHPAVNEVMYRFPLLQKLVVSTSNILLTECPKHSGISLGDILIQYYEQWHLNIMFALEHIVVPVIISALTCLEVCHLQELSLLSGAAAGALITGNILCAFLCGTFCGFILPWLLVKCAERSLLPTSTAIISVGGSAIISGMLASVFCGLVTFVIGAVSHGLFDVASVLAVHLVGSAYLGFIIYGAVLGWAVSWGSENGYYHVVMLPLIALYMDQGHFSVLGTLDMLCLCAPCAGVCSAVFVLGHIRNHTAFRSDSLSDGTQQSTAPHSSECNPVEINVEKSYVSIPVPVQSCSTTGQDKHSSSRSPAPSRSLSVSDQFISEGLSAISGNTLETLDLIPDIPIESFVEVPQPSSAPSSSVQSTSSPSVLDAVPTSSSSSSHVKAVPAPESQSGGRTQEDYSHHIRLGLKGTVSNLLMGDYVEACYPYTLTNRWVLLSVRISCAVSGALVLGYFRMLHDRSTSLSSCSSEYCDVSTPASNMLRKEGSHVFQSSAYLPLPLAMMLALLGSSDDYYDSARHNDINNDWFRYGTIGEAFLRLVHPNACTALVLAVTVAYGLPFFTTMVIYSRKGMLQPKLKCT